MPRRDECLALLPCLNEGRSIGALVRSVAEYVAGVVVVDDGSTDDTAAAAQAAGAVVLRHPHPQGKGASLREGWAQCARSGLEWALCLDGDGQHAPVDIPRLLEAAERTGADLVVGDRFAGGGRMPAVRWATNRVMSAVLGAVAGCDLPDSQCGFRLLRPRRVAELQLRTTHFQIESEVLLAAVRAGWRTAFVPVQTIYRDETSKIRPWRDTVRWVGWLAAEIGRKGGRERAISGS